MTLASQSLFDDDLISSEGVSLDLPAASLPIRVLSGALDLLAAVLVCLSGLLVMFFAIPVPDDAIAQALIILVGAVIPFVLFPLLMEALTGGRSLGKLALGLRTVRMDGGPITLRAAAARALVGFVEIFVTGGVAALITAMCTERSRRAGDLIAGTYVVGIRSRWSRPAPLHGPPQLQPWARNADIGHLPDALVVGMRQFLTRAGSLQPQARTSLGQELYTATLEHVAPAPPPGHHPEAVMMAVLEERRRRSSHQLQQARELKHRLVGQGPR